MARIPSFVLGKLYVRGSLRNTSRGCEFSIRNGIGTGTASRFVALEVDSVSYPPEALSLVSSEGSLQPVALISPQAPMPLILGQVLTICLTEVTLPVGAHRLRLRLETKSA